MSNGRAEAWNGQERKDRCWSCKYAGITDSYLTCDYLLITDETRGCAVDQHCFRYEKGKKLSTKAQRAMGHNPALRTRNALKNKKC